MAKTSVKPSPTSGPLRPKPTIRFDLGEGLPSRLPAVNSEVTLTVKGTLVKIAAKDADFNEYATITVRPSSVVVNDGKKK